MQELISNEQLVADIQSGINVEQNKVLLWEQNQGIIHKLAKKYSSCSSAEYDDLVQESYFALDEAVKHYDPDSEALFFTYAIFWIKQVMVRYCQGSSGSVKISEQSLDNLRRYNRFVNAFFLNIGRKPTDAEICSYLNITGRTLANIQKAGRMGQIKSLDEPVNEDDVTLGDLVPDSCSIEEGVLDAVEYEELQQTLWPMVEELPELLGDVLKLRYRKGATIQETSDMLGITYNKARTAEQDALRALRRPSRKRKLEPFLPDDVVARAYHGSVRGFNRSWTSSTEGAALKLFREE